MSKKRDPLVTVFALAYILLKNNTNYQNQQKQLTVTRTKWEEIKEEQKGKNSNGQQEQ